MAEVLSAMKGLASARAVIVQRARHELLAGAGLARDQHGHEERARRPMARNTCCMAGARPSSSGMRGVPPASLAALHAGIGRAPHERHRLVDVEGLGQVLERPTLVGRHGAPQVRVRRHDDDRQRRARVADAAQELQPRGTRHADVGDQHVGGFAPQCLERRLRRIEHARAHAAVLQRPLEHPADRSVVVDQPHTQCFAVHDSSPSGSSSVNTVRRGSLSNSMMPPLRVTSSCATANPRPVPLVRPVTSG